MRRMLDVSLFAVLFSRTHGRVRYVNGAKPPSLDCDSSAFTESDCSGWASWIGARCSGGEGWLEGASYQMFSMAAAAGWPRTPVESVLSGSAPSGLYVLFIAPEAGEEGHVFFASNGLTFECCADGGVTSRGALEPVLEKACAAYLCGLYVDPSLAFGEE